MPWVWTSLLIEGSEREKGKEPRHSLKELQHLEIMWTMSQQKRLRKRNKRGLADCHIKKAKGREF